MMEKQQDILGYVGLGVSVVGALASVITNNIALASLPLAVGVGCNVFSRKQLNDSLVEAYNQQQKTIDDLLFKLDTNQTELKEKLAENKSDLGTNIEKLQQSLKESLNDQGYRIGKLEAGFLKLNQVVENMKEVESLSQELRVKPNSAEFFYQRGIGFEKLGNKAGAIEDYTEAIKKDPSFAKAYHKRGVLYLDNGSKQKAVDDLRKAALLYFEQGDIDSYHQAREMSRNIHELRTEGNGTNKEMVVGTQLFP